MDRIRLTMDAPPKRRGSSHSRAEVVCRRCCAREVAECRAAGLRGAPQSVVALLRPVHPGAYLEATVNPATGGYHLPKVSVRLFGEGVEDVPMLGGYLHDSYGEAEVFSQLLQQRVKGAVFFKTLLLRRLGNSMDAGRRTVRWVRSAARQRVGPRRVEISMNEQPQ